MDEFKTSLLQIFQLQAQKQVEQEEKFRKAQLEQEKFQKAHLEQEEKFQERLLRQQNHLEQLLIQSQEEQEEQKRILEATNQRRSENEGSFS